MCLALPGKVKKIAGRKALIESSGSEKWVLVGEKNVQVDDWVQIQMGVIIAIISDSTVIVSDPLSLP